jgi:acetyltransferase-like isoleucine patch superfamily enzyme
MDDQKERLLKPQTPEPSDIPAGVFAAGDPCRVIREIRE